MATQAMQILKKSRKVEFRDGITKAELVSIILKMVPRVVADEDVTPYQFTGSDPREISVEEMGGDHGFLSGIGDMLGGIGDIFGSKKSES